MQEQPGEAPTPHAPAEAPAEETATVAATNGSMSVRDRLRKAHADALGDRTKVFPIAPGVYDGLAAKLRPINYDLRRKLTRRAERTGASGEEANLNFQAALLADACVEILMRPEPGADFKPLVDQVDEFRGGEPIVFDTRLADILGIEPPQGASAATIARLVFIDPVVFDAFYTQFSLWSTQVVPDDEDEEDDGDGAEDRPT